MIFKFGRKIDLKKNWSVKKAPWAQGSCSLLSGYGLLQTVHHIHIQFKHSSSRKAFSEKKIRTVIYCRILKRFCLQWKAFDFLNKMRYIFWVLVLLEACDITNNCRHLGFYQELEIRLKPREMVIFCVIHEK